MSATEPLKRSLSRLGVLLITLSNVTPAASVFIMGQDVIRQAGTGALLCFMAAGLLGLATAYVYAELSSAFPLTGGEYSIIGRTLGPVWGFLTLASIWSAAAWARRSRRWGWPSIWAW